MNNELIINELLVEGLEDWHGLWWICSYFQDESNDIIKTLDNASHYCTNPKPRKRRIKINIRNNEHPNNNVPINLVPIELK